MATVLLVTGCIGYCGVAGRMHDDGGDDDGGGGGDDIDDMF